MFQIDDPTAVAALPTPETAGTQGFFTEGDPGSNIPATNVRASFLNMLQQELVNTVTAGGLTPSKTTYTQLRDAIKALARGQFTELLAGSGWVKFPDGLIIQWFGGTAQIAGASVNYPIAFPTGVFKVIVSPANGSTVNPVSVSSSPGNSSCTVYSQTGTGATLFDAIAIGY